MLPTLLGGLRNEQSTTKRVIDAIPADKGDYRPDPNAKSSMELASHIVTAELMFLDGIASGAFAPPPSVPSDVRDSAGLSAWYSQMFEEKAGKVEALTADQLSQVLDFHGVFQMPAVMFLQIATLHSVHHRGQLSVYLRPMGSKVPAIYGESYDSAQARKAQQA